MTRYQSTIMRWAELSEELDNTDRKEDFNEVIQKWAPDGVAVEKKDCLSHHEVMARAEVYDADRGVKLVGHRVRETRPWHDSGN